MRDDLVPQLDIYLATVKDASFEYGKMDCGIFVSGWAKIVTGTDGHAALGAWSDEAAAEALLQQKSTVEFIDTFLQRKALPSARVGDIVALKEDAFGVAALGICLGRRSVFLRPPGQTGYGFVNTKDCSVAWEIL